MSPRRAIVLAVAFAFFAFGWIGGGDAKLVAATALWLGSGLMLPYLVYAALLGGALTLMILALRRYPLPPGCSGQRWIDRLHDSKSGVPYGIALAIAGLLVYPETRNIPPLLGLICTPQLEQGSVNRKCKASVNQVLTLWPIIDPSKSLGAFGSGVEWSVPMRSLADRASAGCAACRRPCRIPRRRGGGGQPCGRRRPTTVIPEARAQILVAKSQFGVGERLSDNNLEWQDWPEGAVRAEYITICRHARSHRPT